MSEYAEAQWKLLESAATHRLMGAVHTAHYFVRAARALGEFSPEMHAIHGKLIERADPLNGTISEAA